MRQSRAQKCESQLRKARRRVRDLQMACRYYSQELARLNRLLFEEAVDKGLYDYAQGM